MTLHITIVAENQEAELKWLQNLRGVTQRLPGLTIGAATEEGSPQKYGQVIFVDGSIHLLESRLDQLERSGRAIFLLATEKPKSSIAKDLMEYWSLLIESGKADDVLVFPFRELEVQSKLRHYDQIMMWEQVSTLNKSFSNLIEKLQEDLKLAERLQKYQAPVRFPAVKGFNVCSRYLAGLKSGGDYFDLAESKAGNQLSVVLADSSSYGLSSALLSVLMRVAMKLSFDEARSCEETVRKIHEELLLILNDKDKLSLFYGVISRKDYCLRYVNLGSSCAFYAQPGQNFRILPSQGAQVTRAGVGLPLGEFQAELPMEPQGRLALVSDGFLEVMGGESKILSTLNLFRDNEASDSLNELAFVLKSQLSEQDDVPAQDCTAVLLDVDAKILRKI